MSEPTGPAGLHAADLGRDEVRALGRDVEQAAVLLGWRSEPEGPEDLRSALAGLLAGDVRRLQLHYRHGSRGWLDTLLARPLGARLVRRELPATDSGLRSD